MKSLVLPDIEEYAEAHSLPESDICRRIREETYRKMKFPQMVVGPLEGAFLKVMTMSVGARSVLEIGTFTGYSALCFAESLPDDGKVVTCDIDPDATDMAKRFWAQSPHGRKIDLRLAPALDTLGQLTEKFDVIFIDADKGNYVHYFHRSLGLVSDRGIMLIDNVLWNGDVLKYPAPDTNTAAIQELNRVVHADPRVSAVLLTIRDGILLIKPTPARHTQKQGQQQNQQ